MDKEEFDKKILDPIQDKPQLVGLANFHLANLHAAIAGLMDLGHRVALDFAPAPAPLEWPKMLYRGTGLGPNDTMLVHARDEEEKALADDWRLTPKPVIPVASIDEDPHHGQ